MRCWIQAMPDTRHTHVLYYFWTTMYVLRAFVMVSYVAFANASLAVAERNLRAILLMVLVVAFLLDLDECAAMPALHATAAPLHPVPSPAPS